MERVSYDEAREWFWVRTAVWFVPAALISVMAHFSFAGDLIGPFGARVWISLGEGVAATLLAVAAAYITMQLPWMREGWRVSHLLNGPSCAAIAGVAAVVLGGIILNALQSNPPNQVEHKAAYDAYLVMIDAAYRMAQFGVGAAAFWAFIFGSWFSMRRDKYFIEPI